mmetsp:Transcript_4556/g.6035  ORF Transcript_4556/g.6035 Transcript_4556/m.6035 type:complete len:224 (-) Transcript_4556:420-1091(-)
MNAHFQTAGGGHRKSQSICLLAHTLASLLVVAHGEKVGLRVAEDPIRTDFARLILARLEQVRIFRDLTREETLRWFVHFLLLAQALFFKFLSFGVDTGELLTAQLVVGVFEALEKAVLRVLRALIFLLVKDDCLRVRNSRVAHRDECVVSVQLRIAIFPDQVVDMGWLSLFLKSVRLSIDDAIEKLIVRENLIFESLDPHDVLVGDEASGLPLLHIFHALHLA